MYFHCFSIYPSTRSSVVPTATHPSASTDDLEARFESELGPLVATLLGVVGPMTTERMRVVLARAGHFAPLLAEGYDHADLQGLVDWVVDDEVAFFRTGDDLVAHVPSLLDGILLTHVLTPTEAARGMLDLGDDLAVLTRGRLRLPLATDGEAVVHHRWDQHADLARAASELGLPAHPLAADDGSLVGPPGWLAGLAAGAPVAAGIRGERLAVVPATAAGATTRPSPHLLEALVGAAERRAWCADDGDGAEDLLLDALAHDPTLLRTSDAPLSVALDTLGLRSALRGDHEREERDERDEPGVPAPSGSPVSHR